MKARKIITGVLAAAVMATIVASPAQAVDSKLYPGSMCVQFAGSTAVLPTLNSSRLFNPATTVLSLDCPVVHDSINESIQDGYVDVIDQNFADDVSGDRNVQVCADLMSVSQAFSLRVTVRSPGRRCTIGASSVSQRLTVGGISANSNAHYFYSVTIPPTFNGARSGIISYEIDEND